jgi:hypothetical protein
LNKVLAPYPSDRPKPASPTARFAPKRAAEQTDNRGVNFGRRSPASWSGPLGADNLANWN